MRYHLTLSAALAWTCLLGSPAWAAPCAPEEPGRNVTGVEQCLVTKEFGASEPEALLIWLHGDISSGGPANYHFPVAQKAAEDFADRKVRSVALVRPGYPDGEGRSSSAAFLHGGRRDHYTRVNMEELIGAIQKLRDRYKPRQLVIIGHSGGAAMAANLLGMAPGLVHGAVLVACPCDLATWRAGRSAWDRSESPIKWVDKIAPTTRVMALTGEADDNTLPSLASAYVEAAQKAGANASYQTIPNATHNNAFRSPMVSSAIEHLLRPVP